MAELPIGNITTANASIVLIVDELYPAGIPLQMCTLDNGISSDAITLAADRMTLDGHIVAGYTPTIKSVTVNLEAPSPSYAVLSRLYRASEQNRRFYTCSIVVTLPELKKSFVWSKGLLVSGTILPNVKQVLDPTSWTFHFEKFYVQGL